MKINRQSLAYRLLAPILVAVALISIALVLFVRHLTTQIIDDYHHFVASSLAAETSHLLDSSLAELTTAQLLDNPAVVEAKQQFLLEAIALRWQRQGSGGAIVGQDGKSLLTTLPPDLTRRILTTTKSGFFHVDDEQGEHVGRITEFHPWGWRVITVGKGEGRQVSTGKVILLLPVILVGFLLLATALLVILRRTLHQPMTALVAAVAREETVAMSGVAEFDRFGAAYNQSLERIRERTAALATELGERKRAEAVVRDKETRIRQLLNSTAEGIYGVDTAGLCTFCNPACCRMLGYAGEEALLGRQIHSLVHHTFPDGRPYPEAECRVCQAFRTGEGGHVDDEVFWRADGTSFPVEYWSYPVLAEDGRATGAVVAFFDISERRQADVALRKASQEWQTTFDSTADLIALLAPDGIIRQANRALASFCGIAAQDLCGRKCYEVLHHSADHIGNCPLVKARTTLRREEMELRVADRTYLVVVDPILDEAGQLIGAVHTMHDFTEHKQAEEALRAEKNKVEAFIAAMGDGVSIQDRDFTVLYQNEVHRGFVGAHLGERCYQAYEARGSVCEGCPVALSFRDGHVHTVQRALKHPEGTRHFEITASPVYDAAGTIVAGIEVVRDVTDRLRVEEQLRQAQKMEGIGHLAGGVAHDFNNVLSVVQGYCELLKYSLPDSDSRKEYVNQIDAAIRRGATITRQILAFSRKQAITIQPVNLNDLVSGLQKMLRRLVREDIDLVVHLPAEPLVVSADAGQIDQVVINLATNACHAMPDGGSLRIDLERTCLDGEFMRAFGDRRPAGDYARLMVTDTGIGMEEAVRSRIFEPFFTTKEAGKGTGLGLAMVYGIIQKHNGFINVYSEPGHGTVFKIYLPIATPAAVKDDNRSTKEGEAPFLKGTETLLVAEDEPQVRQLSRTILEMAGYTVIEAADGEEAVRLFVEHQEGVNLVMLDGIMPHRNGKEALVAMRQLRPDLKAIILSGYAEDVFTQGDITDLKVTFVQKPVTAETILRKVRETLDQ